MSIGDNPLVQRVFYQISRWIQIPTSRTIAGETFQVIATPQTLHNFSNEYEEDFIASWTSLLYEGATVADIGSGVGVFAMVASRKVGDVGVVHAFEASPIRAKLMRKLVELNNIDNLIIHQKAVSSKSEAIEVDVNHITGTVAEDCSEDNIGADTVTRESIEAISLDETNITPDVIKIDVEGFEVEVLEGMADILEHHRPQILCEVHPDGIEHTGRTVEDLHDILNEHNYGVRRPSTDEQREVPISPHERHYLFYPKN